MLQNVRRLEGRVTAARGDTLVVRLDRRDADGFHPQVIVVRGPGVSLETEQLSASRTVATTALSTVLLIAAAFLVLWANSED